ncbi:site-specific integrase [Oceanisphaera sp. IT1-181]|uniref:site-specific integrase n=1 Tax=Oceanisphaera sp. IT1-181 TaxID=3081199 RepID=UPI0029CA255C|nr:site-specific integrase [Oceanisphaera sp. IT1-181]
MNSSNKPELNTATHELLNPSQISWLEKQKLPKRLYLVSATEFDDKWINIDSDRWEFRFSGRNVVIDFEKGSNFKKLPKITLKLTKLLVIKYLSINSGYNSSYFAGDLGRIFKSITSLTHESLIEKLYELNINESTAKEFFSVLFILRRLDIEYFFNSTNHNESLEDKLLLVPRPAFSSWGIYSDIDNTLPESVVLMIQNGLQRWSSKLTPSLITEEEKRQHLFKIKKVISIEKLRDCVITGLIFTTGLRPVQLSKTAVGDIIIDTEISNLTRFSYAVPYAKKSKVHTHRVRVAIPEELGKLVLLYQRLADLKLGEPLFPQIQDSVTMVNQAINRQLLRFSPKDMQEAVRQGQAEAPEYTSSLFRHHVGHSMAMSGASAEEIAYILGHTSTVVANRYISATPDLSTIREQALGRNPVFSNMITLMLTGNLVYSESWTGRKVAGAG